LIVVDASALVAIALREPERTQFLAVLGGSDLNWLAPMNYVEAGLVLIRRRLINSQQRFDAWLESIDVELKDDLELGSDALAAYLRFGKGLHPARLNLGDCFAYALAKQLDAPLLYKGDDFAKTDIRSALQPT
jgi:ribonuclease VapC